MSTKTENLKLTKPAATDIVDISEINENMDIIDENLATRAEMNTIKKNLDDSDAALKSGYESADESIRTDLQLTASRIDNLATRAEMNTIKKNLDDSDAALKSGYESADESIRTDLQLTASRIDNLVANTGDSNSEIVDARVGNDGVTYSTLGSAIRAQINEAFNVERNLLQEVDVKATFGTGEVGGYTTDYYMIAGETYTIRNNNDRGFSFFVFGNSSVAVDVDTMQTNTITPTTDGYLRVYKGNATGSGEYTFKVTRYLKDLTDDLKMYIQKENINHHDGYIFMPFIFENGLWSSHVKHNNIKGSIATIDTVKIKKDIEIVVSEGYKVGVDRIINGAYKSTVTVTPSSSPFIITVGNYDITITKTDKSKSNELVSLYTAVKVNNKSSNNTNTENELRKYRYLAFTFTSRQDTSDLVILGTNDLKRFNLVKERGTYIATKSTYVRDPSIIQIDDWYYLTYTKDDASNEISFCRTKDFSEFEELDNIKIPSGDFYSCWAPAWFRDGTGIYVLTSVQTGRDGAGTGWFRLSVDKYDYVNHTLTNVNLIENNSSIDGHIYKENGKYYLINGQLQTYVADSLSGSFSVLNSTTHSGYEAPFIVKLDNGKYRVFAQGNGHNEKIKQHYYYEDISSLSNAIDFTNPKQVEYDNNTLNYTRNLGNKKGEYWHWTIFDFNQLEGNNNNYYE